MNTSPSAARQDWLEEATVLLRGLFKEHGYEVPANVRVSFGWPRGSHGKGRAIGQCWGSIASTDAHNEIFISPELGISAKAGPDQRDAGSRRILDVLAHELVHATVGVEAGHKGPFKQCAETIGLTGKMTATVAGPEFDDWAGKAVRQIGTFPGGGLVDGWRKKQSTRLLKCECPDCGYTARITRKWIAEAGAPLCPTDGDELEVVE
jgi:hypothetical protein